MQTEQAKITTREKNLADKYLTSMFYYLPLVIELWGVGSNGLIRYAWPT